jgi:hypothetical protein
MKIFTRDENSTLDRFVEKVFWVVGFCKSCTAANIELIFTRYVDDNTCYFVFCVIP